MANDETPLEGLDRPQPLFAKTHWSVVLAAGGSDSRAHEALASLCSDYWYPLYAYARRRDFSPHDAQDLTQEFFARLLKGNWVSQADPKRGRFRSFLLSAMKHFMANEWKRAHTRKRGGGQPSVSLNDESAERRYALEPIEKETPESLFERRWALALLDSVLTQLENEYRNEGKGAWMDAMRSALITDREALDYKDVAQKLNMTETAARVSVHRMRKRYRQLLPAEVGRTLASSQQIENEIRHLFQVLTTR
jgi:RNA polymerase sigma-70 factor (ECF subfamily)